MEQYQALQDKYQYDCLLVWFGGVFIQDVLNDQALNSKRLRWVQAATAGLDNYVTAKNFQSSDIILTNSKGMFSRALAEFVAMGMLFHTK
jgi:phosphoglycerate dehydrogenase-like enzyme